MALIIMYLTHSAAFTLGVLMMATICASRCSSDYIEESDGEAASLPEAFSNKRSPSAAQRCQIIPVREARERLKSLHVDRSQSMRPQR